uniref:Uncharacterized protein n=1 Tax=Arundo donax TaxID=35708 RepID=A0A0A8YQA0_ARUDO
MPSRNCTLPQPPPPLAGVPNTSEDPSSLAYQNVPNQPEKCCTGRTKYSRRPNQM